KLSVVLGIVSLCLTFWLVSLFGSRALAGWSVGLMAASSAFVYPHTLIVHYEVLPWLFIATALLLLFAGGERTGSLPRAKLSTGRIAGAAFLTGLAVLSNVKALFIIAPLVMVAWRAGGRLGTLKPAQWVTAGATASLAVSP